MGIEQKYLQVFVNDIRLETKIIMYADAAKSAWIYIPLE